MWEKQILARAIGMQKENWGVTTYCSEIFIKGTIALKSFKIHNSVRHFLSKFKLNYNTSKNAGLPPILFLHSLAKICFSRIVINCPKIPL